MIRERPSWDDYFMEIAFQTAQRGSCSRRAVGAVVVRENRIKGTGYNGSPPGMPHCIDDGCEMKDGHCIRCVHAEPNALLECSPEERKGATLYSTDFPCPECQKIIIASGISKVVFARHYDPYINWFDQLEKNEKGENPISVLQLPHFSQRPLCE